MNIQNKTKEELIIILQELLQENNSLRAQKEKRAAALSIANIELEYQSEEKEKRAEELIIANVELAFQKGEKGKRAEELILEKIKIALQRDEKEKLAAELIIANLALVLQEELIEAKEKAEESEKKFKLLYENAPLSYQSLDINACLIDVNPTWLQTLGYKREEVIGRPFSDFMTSESAKLIKERFPAFVDKGEIHNYEFEMIRKDGIRFLVSYDGKIGYDELGHFNKTHCIFTDITVRRQAEKEREQFFNFFKLSPDIMVIADPNGAFKAVNPAATALLGYSEEELLSKPFIDFVHPDDKQITLDEMARQIKIGSSLNFENRYLSKNDSYILLSWCAYFNKDEGITYATARDVTNERMIEAELIKAKEKAERNENYYNTIINKIGDPIFVKDDQSRLVLVNNAFCKLFDISRSKIIGKTLVEDVSPDERDSFLKIDREVFTDGLENINEESITVRGGETRIFLTNKNRFFDKNGTKYLIGISHDITNRKNSEKELIKLSRAIEQSPVSIFITNLEGDIEYANPKVTAITGYKKSEIIGQNPRMFSSGEKSKEGYAALWKTINAGNEWFGEFHNKKKNGELFWEYASISPIKDTDGKITHYLAVKEDITKQKELINDLEEIKTKALEGQKSYKALFETIGDAIYIQDYDANFINVNSGVLSMYGYSKEELIGNTPIFLSAPDMNDISAVFESFDKVKQGIPQVFEFWGKRKNGEIFPKTVSQYKGTYFGQDVVITVARDITERKQAEDALKESEREFRQLSESMPQIVWVTRADGWNIYFNQQWVDYTGLSLEESYGHGWNKPFHPDDQQLAWDAWHNAVTKKVIYSIESRLRQNDGTYQWWLVRGVPILDENNKIIKWFGTCTNIDEIKIAEIELINAKNKAEESDRLKSAFLANMSHEIRTPMNGILGFADFLKTPNLSDEKQQKYLMVIERSGKRMLNIIDDIISISKIESGVMEVNLEASNVNEQMEYIYTFFKPEVDAKGINFSYKNSLPLKEAIVKTDREKLFAILTNLVKNAIKYTDKGSIAFGYYKKDNFLQFYVKDSGIGVPKDRQEAIFERFIQADISDKMAKQGAGLGLSITKAYVEMLGGKLWLASEEGKGSVFYFTLPYQNGIITEEIVKIEVLSPIEISSTKKLKILVVDDDEASELLISIAIKEFADEIIVARNGIEAVEACRTNPDIDLILMDIQMPEMNGYEATKQIRKFNTHVPIIAQTAYALTGDMEKVMAAGCNDYIKKPIKVYELKQLISLYSLIK